MEDPKFIKPSVVLARGSSMIRFRNATVEDAAFILSLRTDPKKNAYLSATPDDLGAQRQWMERYGSDSEQVYFIIEHSEPIGTVRLYNRRGDSFEWGSWILSSGAPFGTARITLLMVYAFGLELGFTRSHFEVRRGNEKVWRFHESMGAKRVRETELDLFYEIDNAAILEALAKYQSRLPGIEVVWNS